MWSVIYAFVCIIGVVQPKIFNKIINIDADGWIDFGSYDAKVKIGKLPDIYELTEEDKKASEFAIQLLEYFRKIFPTGIFTIPPLDPFKINQINPFIINTKDTPYLTGKIDIKDILIKGGKDFNIKLLEIRMKEDFRVDFDVKIPSLNGHVSLYTDLKLAGIIPINFNAIVTFCIKEISSIGAVYAIEKKYGDKVVYQVENVDVHFHADEVYVNLKAPDNLIQHIVGLLTKTNIQNTQTVKAMEKLINNYIANKLIEELNKILLGFSVTDIKTFLES